MKKLVALIIAVLAIVVVASSAMAMEYEMQRHFVFFNVNEHIIPEKVVYDKLSGISKDSQISVFGYADQRGSVEWNRQLAQLRADFLASVIKKQLPGINFREVTGIIDKNTANATTGEIRIFTPKRDLAAIQNAIGESDQKVLTGLDELGKNLDESDRKVLTGIEEMKETINKSDQEVLTGLGRIEEELSALDKILKSNAFFTIASTLISLLVFFLILLLFLFRKRLFGKAESSEVEYWPEAMNLVADMYLNKKNGDQKKKCPFCNAEVRGKNYVAHLRRCENSFLHGKSAEEAKETLKAGGAK
jgi:hypothetical protein